MTTPERGLWIEDPRDRADLATFVERALRLDDAAVVRLRERTGGQERSERGIGTGGAFVAWVATGLDVLASRVVTGRVRPSDLSAGADALVTGLSTATDAYVDPGFPMDSAWRGGLPPEGGFVHLDDIPARVMLDLAQQGGALAREHSECPRAAGLAVGPGGDRRQRRRSQCGRSDALRLRADRHGVSAADRQRGERAGDRPGPRAPVVVAHRRPLRLGVPASRQRRADRGVRIGRTACHRVTSS